MLEDRLATACAAAEAMAKAQSASTAACTQARLSAAALHDHRAVLAKLQAAAAQPGATLNRIDIRGSCTFPLSTDRMLLIPIDVKA